MEKEKTIYQKLLSCKMKFTAITKDQKNPHFKSAYYDINDLHKMVDPILHEEGLIILNPISDGKIVTELVDVASGEKLTSSFTLNDNINPQKIGSEITYFRRYLLSSLLGLQAEDDDGNKASAPKAKATPQKKKLSDVKFNELTLTVESGEKTEAEFRKSFEDSNFIITPEQEVILKEAVGAFNLKQV